MWDIAICESDYSFAEQVENKLNNFFSHHEMEIRIQKYFDSVSFIDELEQPRDLILLCTKLSDANGYSVARLICDNNTRQGNNIIFLGEDDANISTAFEFWPFGYIKKVNWNKNSDEVLTRLLVRDHLERSVEVLLFQQKKQIKVTSIIYIQRKGHYLNFYCLRNEFYHFRGELEKYDRLLRGYYFVHVTKTYLVNCAYIKEISDIVRFKDGTVIRCSKAYRENARNMWFRYLKEMSTSF
jgi:DNA-binding LytR/AlgR family response regulator